MPGMRSPRPGADALAGTAQRSSPVTLDSLLQEIEKLNRLRALDLPPGLFAGISAKVLHAYRERAAVEEPFERWAKTQLANSMLLHADETGVSIGGNRHWLHCASSDTLAWFAPYTKRGAKAMNEIGILPICKDVRFPAFMSVEHV